MALKLNSYEHQAKLSVVLALLGAACTAGALTGVFYRFDWQNFWSVYGSGSPRMPLVAGGVLAALLASGIGFLVGLNSAGQRRNQNQRLSWMGFFFNALVITMALSTAIFFYFVRYKVNLDR